MPNVVNMLNLTLPLKQDQKSQADLKEIGEKFGTEYWPTIEKALAKSKLVHHARFVLIGKQFIQIITEFDGDIEPYTEFFSIELADIFRVLFRLVEGVPEGADPTKPDQLFEFIKRANIPSLGAGEFHAYGHRSIQEVLGDIKLAAAVRNLVEG